MHECKLSKCSLGLHMEQAEEINLDVCGDVLTCAYVQPSKLNCFKALPHIL